MEIRELACVCPHRRTGVTARMVKRGGCREASERISEVFFRGGGGRRDGCFCRVFEGCFGKMRCLRVVVCGETVVECVVLLVGRQALFRALN